MPRRASGCLGRVSLTRSATRSHVSERLTYPPRVASHKEFGPSDGFPALQDSRARALHRGVRRALASSAARDGPEMSLADRTRLQCRRTAPALILHYNLALVLRCRVGDTLGRRPISPSPHLPSMDSESEPRESPSQETVEPITSERVVISSRSSSSSLVRR
jgi:hypothetical protein